MAYQKPSKGAPRTSTGLHRNAAFFGDLVDVVGHFKSGRKPPSGGAAFDRRGPMVFIENKTGANLKLGEAVELGDYLLDEEDPYKWWLEGNAVSTTFGLRYAIAAEPIETDAIGAAWVRGPAVIRYTGSAPSSGDGMGPKPSQETLEPGFPCFAIVDDVIDTSEKLLLGTLGEVRTLLCLTTGTIGPAATSSGFTVQSGDPSSNANSGFAPPTVHLGMTIDSGKLFVAHWLNNCWVGMPWECNDE